MKANESFICRFLDGADKKFVIPVYQRPYSWKKSDCKLLFDDLMTVYREKYSSHFFGSLVYVANDIGGCWEYLIIDGQQRITTTSLLLLAIRNYVTETDIDVRINPEKITDTYLQDKYAQNENKLKLKLVQGDDTAYDKLINNQKADPDSAVVVNYNFLYEQISQLTPDELTGLYDAIMKLAVVNISLYPTEGDDPQLIFESLNSTGQDLEESDKIRNYVLMNMNSSDQAWFYRQYWEVLERTVSRDDINNFIRFYLAVKNRALPNKKKLYFVFKHYIEDNNLLKEDVLKDMLVYANFYKIVNYPDKTDHSCREVLNRLKKLNVNSTTPLLFDLMMYNQQGVITKTELNEAMRIIENFVIRREICGLPTNALNKLFVSLGSEIGKYIENNDISCLEAFKSAILSKTGKSRFPNNHEFEDKFINYELYNANSIIKKYILEELENYGTKEKIAVEDQINDGTLTIEHIMPQTMNPDWIQVLGDNWELVHSKYIDTIGNLTLTAYNSDYSNLSFAKKKTMPDKGFNFSKLSLNTFVKECDTWGEKQIVDRAKILQKKAQKIWWSPVTAYKPEFDDVWISWDDDFDFTNQVITKIRILGDEISVKNMSDAYRKVNEILYSLDPIEYVHVDEKCISRDASAMRRSAQVGEDVYIEMNLASQEKVNVIIRMMGYFDFDSQDLLFLVKKGFDVNDESTYDTVTPGKLAYGLLEDLANRGKLTAEDVELLKTKEYTRETFKKVVYPVLAEHREDHKGKSSRFRYKKKPITVNGEKFFVTGEWFEESKPDLIKWYNERK